DAALDILTEQRVGRLVCDALVDRTARLLRQPGHSGASEECKRIADVGAVVADQLACALGSAQSADCDISDALLERPGKVGAKQTSQVGLNTALRPQIVPNIGDRPPDTAYRHTQTRN